MDKQGELVVEMEIALENYIKERKENMKKDVDLVKIPKMILLEENEFIKFMNTLSEMNNKHINENIAIAVNFENKNFIFINRNEYDDMDDDYKNIIIAHECAYCNGIENEEEADKWALDALKDNENASNKLINMWEHRHGHEY